MGKSWRIFAHPDYFRRFREVVLNPDERFKVTTQLRAFLKGIHNPSRALTPVPGESNQFELDLLHYTIIVHWHEREPDDIRLLEIYER